jgi:hypothetical protein
MPNPEKVAKVMHEFKHGTLKSSSGQKVTSRDQAVAIAMSEAGMSKDREGRVADGKGNFVIHGPAQKDHGYNRKNGKRGEYDAKTGAVEYEGETKPEFRFGK